jgi:Zn-dependent oligopeptidase
LLRQPIIFYGLNFKETKDVPVYHHDLKVFEVKEGADKFIGLLYVDLYPRETKRGGSVDDQFPFTGTFQGRDSKTVDSIVGNMTPSTADTPSLLTLNEVQTLFHEFGHALHGLLSDCKYPSLASPNVYWDFVELPSQIMENWVTEVETLKLFAYHYQTGDLIPQELIDKVKRAEKFNKGIFISDS